MKEKTEKRVFGLFLLMAAILVYVTLSTLHTMRQSLRGREWVNKTQDILNQANAILSSLHAGDAAARTFILTGSDGDREAYRKAYNEMNTHLGLARTLCREGEGRDLESRQLDDLENLIRDHIDLTRSAVQAREKSGLEEAQKYLSDHPEGEKIPKIGRAIMDINTQEDTLLQKYDKEAHLDAQATRQTVYLGAAANVALLIFAAWLVADDIAARRRASKALEDANSLLESRVADRTAELVKANHVLKQENLERKWSNQSIEHQLRYNQLIINTVQEMVFVISKALNISRINPAVSESTHWTPQEIVAQSLDRVLQCQNESADGAPAQNPITQAMVQGREILDREGLLLSKAGQPTPVKFSMVPLRDQDKVVGAVVTVRMRNGADKSS